MLVHRDHRHLPATAAPFPQPTPDQPSPSAAVLQPLPIIVTETSILSSDAGRPAAVAMTTRVDRLTTVAHAISSDSTIAQ